MRKSENHRQSLFASVVTKTVFREMTEKNAHFTGKLQSSMVTDRPNVRPYETSSSSGKADYALSQTASQEGKLEEMEEEDRNRMMKW